MWECGEGQTDRHIDARDQFRLGYMPHAKRRPNDVPLGLQCLDGRHNVSAGRGDTRLFIFIYVFIRSSVNADVTRLQRRAVAASCFRLGLHLAANPLIRARGRR